MSNSVMGLQVGQRVPSFEIETYDPVREDFGTISLDRLKAEGKWTILFFYPADFTSKMVGHVHEALAET